MSNPAATPLDALEPVMDRVRVLCNTMEEAGTEAGNLKVFLPCRETDIARAEKTYGAAWTELRALVTALWERGNRETDDA